MRSICPKCGSHNVTITATEVICNCCDTTIDFRDDIKDVWAYDAQPVNLLTEAKMYNRMYHNPQSITNMKRSTR